MEKLSGILPSNARVTTVDMQASGSARPGTPSFGRKKGVSALAGRKDAQTTAMKAMEAHKSLTSKQELAAQKADMVQNMADKFFVNRRFEMAKEAEQPSISTRTFETEVSAPITELQTSSSVNVAQEGPTDIHQEDDLDAPEFGRYLDVVA